MGPSESNTAPSCASPRIDRELCFRAAAVPRRRLDHLYRRDPHAARRAPRRVALDVLAACRGGGGDGLESNDAARGAARLRSWDQGMCVSGNEAAGTQVQPWCSTPQGQRPGRQAHVGAHKAPTSAAASENMPMLAPTSTTVSPGRSSTCGLAMGILSGYRKRQRVDDGSLARCLQAGWASPALAAAAGRHAAADACPLSQVHNRLTPCCRYTRSTKCS